MNWINKLEEEIQHLLGCDDVEIIMMGDFIYDFLKQVPKRWTEFLQFFNFSQLITEPTRVTESGSTLRDHVYSNRPDNICETNVQPSSASDHYPVCITRHSPKLKPKARHTEIKYRAFKNFDENLSLQNLIESDISRFQNIVCVDQALDVWNKTLMNVLDKSAPIKTKRVKSKQLPPWLITQMSEISEARHKRDMFHKRKEF